MNSYTDMLKEYKDRVRDSALGAFHHQGFLRGFSAQRFFCPFLGQKNSCQSSCDETKKLAGVFQGFFCPKVFLPKGFSALFTLKEHFITRVFQGFFCPKVFLPFFGNLWESGNKAPAKNFFATFPKVSKKGRKAFGAEKPL